MAWDQGMGTVVMSELGLRSQLTLVPWGEGVEDDLAIRLGG